MPGVRFTHMKKIDTNINDLIHALMNLNVKISIGEPWNFGEGKERNPFDAIIHQVFITNHSKGNKINVKESLLLQINQPFPYNSVKCEFLLASPRHVGVGLRDFIKGDHVSFNFLRIPEDEARADNPFRNENFKLNKKCFGLIGSIEK
jgi:hypothetical protein